MKKHDITPNVAAKLVASQFPQWAGLSIRPVNLDGWDNTTFRLGDDLTLRLPSHEVYVPQIEKEHRWLPILARQLPLAIPQPVALGAPSAEFPRPWSIYRWLRGETAHSGRIGNLHVFASDLAQFLTALHAIDARGGPPAGEHNFFRGGHLDTYDGQTRDALRLLRGEIDTPAATRVWEASLASRWDRPAVWVHGDVSSTNLLVEGGTLRAVIDFGCAAIGDPACDLVIAWTFLDDEDARLTFRSGLALDATTWARARGWAVWKALITLAQEKQGGVRADSATTRQGWRSSARAVIDLVIQDHERENAHSL